jgi:hypothetical protein
MGPINTEICSNCGREIARSEQAYVFEGNIVCVECDLQLRSGQFIEPVSIPEPAAESEPITEPQPVVTPEPATAEPIAEPESVTAPEPAAAEPSAIPELMAANEQQPEEPKLEKIEDQNKEKQSQDADKPVGLIVAGVILCLLGIGSIIIGLVSIAASFFFGLPLFGILIAGGCLLLGMLILIAGIAATVIAVVSRRRSSH